VGDEPAECKGKKEDVMEDENYEWALPPTKKSPVSNGDIRKVTLEVEVVVHWEDKIPSEFDDEGYVTGYRSGFIMVVVPNQVFEYTDQETRLLAAAKIVDDSPGSDQKS